MIIILLGSPGSGKGTQAELLTKKYHFAHFSIGKLLREEYEKKSKPGIRGEKYWGEKGINVPSDISFKILTKNINKKTSFILDNFPRTMENLEYLTRYLKRRRLRIDYVFHLILGKTAGLKRLVKRAKEDQLTKGKKRPDETKKLMQVRFNKGYKEDVNKILSFYQKKGLLYNINADDTVNNIHKKIIDVIGICE